MTKLDNYDIISVVGIPVYVILLIGGVFLSIKHGFSKSSGWRFLILLAVARLVSLSLRLATLADPTNLGIYAGWMIANSLGLGPLVLVLLGLLSRIYDSINRQVANPIKPRYNRLIQLLMLVGIVLTVIGGTKSKFTFVDGAIRVHYNTASHISVVISSIVVGLFCLLTFLAFRKREFIEEGEHRLFFGVVASIPFVCVRSVYSCLTVLGGVKPNVWLYLCMGILMEVIVAVMLEVIGFTLRKAPKEPKDNNYGLAEQQER